MCDGRPRTSRANRDPAVQRSRPANAERVTKKNKPGPTRHPTPARLPKEKRPQKQPSQQTNTPTPRPPPNAPRPSTWWPKLGHDGPRRADNVASIPRSAARPEGRGAKSAGQARGPRRWRANHAGPGRIPGRRSLACRRGPGRGRRGSRPERESASAAPTQCPPQFPAGPSGGGLPRNRGPTTRVGGRSPPPAAAASPQRNVSRSPSRRPTLEAAYRRNGPDQRAHHRGGGERGCRGRARNEERDRPRW